MPNAELLARASAYYAEKYEVISPHAFVSRSTTWVDKPESSNQALRRCRFCSRGTEQGATFRKKAHAVPELLGSKTIRSKSECDECNERFGNGIEGHLANRLSFVRSVAHVKGKRGAPGHTSPSGTMKIDSLEGKQQMIFTDQRSADKAQAANGEPFAIQLSVNTNSGKYIPVEAFKALTKIACSICPVNELAECEAAIEWIVKGKRPYSCGFPVLCSIISGPHDAFVSSVTLLRRRCPGPQPYLCCAIQMLNYGFQFFVPFCKSDAELVQCNRMFIPRLPYRPKQIPVAPPFDELEFCLEDWSSEKETQRSYTVDLDEPFAQVVNGPTRAAD